MKKVLKPLLGILILALAISAAFAQHIGRPGLAGSWNSTTTPRNCATGEAITVFKATYNFDRGGTLNFVSSGTGSGGRGREQVGQWKHIGGNHYRFALKAFIFDADGISRSYQIVIHDAEVANNGLSWSSLGDSRTYDFNGVEINRGCSTIEAVRDILD